MKFTRKTDYALRAMASIAEVALQEGPPVSVDELATQQELPRKFLEAIVADRWKPLNVDGHFASVTQLTQVNIYRFGRATNHYRIYLGTGYIP
jgi:hypothetical protein